MISENENYDNENIFHTEAEISENFNKLMNICISFEDQSQKDEDYKKTIFDLKKLEQSIIKHNIFSPNEDFSEIQVENLKFLFLPYYLGDVFGRIMENRKQNISLSKFYLTEYIKFINHYQQVPKNLIKQWKNIEENPEWEPERDEKIQDFKDKRAIESKLKKIQDEERKNIEGDPEMRKEFFTLLIQRYLLTSINNLRMIQTELKILKHKEELEANPELKEQYEKEKNKPAPKPQIYHIPKIDNPNNPYMINSNEKNVDKLCHKCAKLDNMELMGKTEQEIKKEFQERVFQPGFAQPILTLDEFADGEMKMFSEMERKQKEANKRAELEENEDSDKDEVNEKKRIKDSDWDNWKDDHEKGAGNKLRR